MNNFFILMRICSKNVRKYEHFKILFSFFWFWGETTWPCSWLCSWGSPSYTWPRFKRGNQHCWELRTHSSNSGTMQQICVGSNSVWHCLLKGNEWTTSVVFRLKATHKHTSSFGPRMKCVLCWQTIISKAMQMAM